MSLTLDRIEALAPDQASLVAARKLLKPSSWPTLAQGEALVWGECLGSGATPYRVVVSEADAGYKCTCPSRKFPCKHSLALMWMRADKTGNFVPAAVPDWVKDWLSRRRGSAATNKKEDEDQPKSRPSIRLATNADVEEVVDPKAEQRAAAARERNQAEREASILAGLDDLETWLSDQVQQGMANFVSQTAQACRTIAQRLVDAKASGLAGRLDALPTRLFTLPGPVRAAASIRELGEIYLISRAYRNATQLPPLLAADARQAVGWQIARQALFTDAEALRVDATWRVFAMVSEAQADRLRRIETWLWREDGGDEMPRYALLLEFVPIVTGSASTGGYLVGDRVSAELSFYRSTIPLRAQIAAIKRGVEQTQDRLPMPNESLGATYAKYESALSRLPWLGTFPLAFHAAKVRRHGEQLFLCDDANHVSLPLHSSQESHALPLASAGPFDGVGLWDRYEFTLAWAETQWGRWLHA